MSYSLSASNLSKKHRNSQLWSIFLIQQAQSNCHCCRLRAIIIWMQKRSRCSESINILAIVVFFLFGYFSKINRKTPFSFHQKKKKNVPVLGAKHLSPVNFNFLTCKGKEIFVPFWISVSSPITGGKCFYIEMMKQRLKPVPSVEINQYQRLLLRVWLWNSSNRFIC